MSHFGVIVIIAFYDQVQRKFELPYLFTYGFLNMEKNKILVHNWKKTLHKLVNDEKKLSLTELKKKIKEKMENLLSQDLPKNKPLIISIVEGYKVESSKAGNSLLLEENKIKTEQNFP